jgi:hypothetical protein
MLETLLEKNMEPKLQKKIAQLLLVCCDFIQKMIMYQDLLSF